MGFWPVPGISENRDARRSVSRRPRPAVQGPHQVPIRPPVVGTKTGEPKNLLNCVSIFSHRWITFPLTLSIRPDLFPVNGQIDFVYLADYRND